MEFYLNVETGELSEIPAEPKPAPCKTCDCCRWLDGLEMWDCIAGMKEECLEDYR